METNLLEKFTKLESKVSELEDKASELEKKNKQLKFQTISLAAFVVTTVIIELFDIFA